MIIEQDLTVEELQEAIMNVNGSITENQRQVAELRQRTANLAQQRVQLQNALNDITEVK